MTRTALMAALPLLLAGTLARAAQAGNACSATSTAARQACTNEVKDDFWIAVGNCANLPARDLRRPCRAAAKAELADAKEECGEQFEARRELCGLLGPAPYDPPIDPAAFLSPAATAANPNPYLPLVPGTTRTYQGGGQTTVVTVTGETKAILGVTTIVVRDVVSEGGVVIEDTEDYFAQQSDGTVWYFGELSKTFEDGALVDLEGSWQAGRDGAKPGIVMEASPMAGDVYRQEFALGNAEDAGRVTSTTGSESVPAASCAGTCVVIRDFTPFEPGVGEDKYYAPGVGLILELEEGVRNELVSVSP